ncbi:MAG: glycoside hydrolase family 99-like domain-containing protein [Burkholderiales bacterium]
MKIIAFYLPQFHEIPENNEWWGKGFTEWTNVKSAKPLFKGHYQPRIPLNQNYYNLLDPETRQWQAEIAKKHGVYGFCYYHYWFLGKKLLNKPAEEMLRLGQPDMPFCFSWANESWVRTWEGKSKQILIAQEYGGKEDWKKHFEYLLPFFNDRRYILKDGKPFFIIYRPELMDCCNEMLDYWQELAIKSGLGGLTIAYQNVHFSRKADRDESRFAYGIEYQPANAFMRYSDDYVSNPVKRAISVLKRRLRKPYCIITGREDTSRLLDLDYDEIWSYVLSQKPDSDKKIPGAFVDWDNTPRHKGRGSVYKGATPEKFQRYLSKQILRAREVYHKDMLFLFAWNEWAEGGYLEPDEKYRYAYLEAIKAALEETGEYE